MISKSHESIPSLACSQWCIMKGSYWPGWTCLRSPHRTSTGRWSARGSGSAGCLRRWRLYRSSTWWSAQPGLEHVINRYLLHNLVDSSTRRASKTLSLEVYTHIVWMFPPIRSKAARDAHGLLEPDLPRHRNADALVVPGRQGLAHQPHHTSTQQYYLHGVKLRWLWVREHCSYCYILWCTWCSRISLKYDDYLEYHSTTGLHSDEFGSDFICLLRYTTIRVPYT